MRGGGVFPTPRGVPQVATDDYRNEARVSVDELADDPVGVSVRLLNRLLRTISPNGMPDPLKLPRSGQSLGSHREVSLLNQRFGRRERSNQSARDHNAWSYKRLRHRRLSGSIQSEVTQYVFPRSSHQGCRHGDQVQRTLVGDARLFGSG